MPGSTRQWAQRKLNFAHGDIEKAQKHLLECADRYIDGGELPTGTAMKMVAETLDRAKEIIANLKETF